MYSIRKLSLAMGVAATLLAAAAHAQITGFGGNGSGWSLQGNFTPTVTANDLHLASGFSNGTSAFNNTLQTVNSFTASFTFEQFDPFTGFNPGDGFTFAIQNAGPTAVGIGGGDLGFIGIPSATGVAINFWAPGGTGTGFANSSIPYHYMGTGAVNLHLIDPVQVNLSYNGTTLSETLHDLTQNTTFTTSYNVNIASFVGGNTAYVGFTGGSGGAEEDVHITNFSFNASQSVPDAGSTIALFGLALVSLAGFRRKARAA